MRKAMTNWIAWKNKKMSPLFSKIVTIVYENEDNDFIMKYDTYSFISNILMLISKRLRTFAEFILN